MKFSHHAYVTSLVLRPGVEKDEELLDCIKSTGGKIAESGKQEIWRSFHKSPLEGYCWSSRGLINKTVALYKDRGGVCAHVQEFRALSDCDQSVVTKGRKYFPNETLLSLFNIGIQPNPLPAVIFHLRSPCSGNLVETLPLSLDVCVADEENNFFLP